LAVPAWPGNVEITVAPARNWTWVTVTPTPEPGATVVLIVAAVPTVTTAPGKGAVMTVVGAELPTVTVTPVEVTEVAAESTATAVSVYAPAAAGVHATV
jgi:hypothetical protein